MSDKRLLVLIEGEFAGELVQDPSGRMHFSYETSRPRAATPLSLSMPTVVSRHEHRAVRPFVEGLLPDNERVLQRWRQQFDITSRHPFALLKEVGEDVAGAVQFVRPERYEAARSGGSVEWLEAEDIGRWLHALRIDPTMWHYKRHGPQWSLTGAQAKLALLYDGTRWGRPGGATPTTHILKPTIPGYEHHDVNEHVCLEIGRRLGIPTARTRLQEFARTRALVVERYDRLERDGRWLRVHQEDFCQALGILPEHKYQREGGPGPRRMAELLWRAQPGAEARRCVIDLVDQLAFQWLIGGSDAHAKNFSLLLSGQRVRLAPLYDAASALVYDDPDYGLDGLDLAMTIGGQRRLCQIGRREWGKLAVDVGLSSSEVIDRVGALTANLPQAVSDVCGEPSLEKMAAEMVARLHRVFVARGKECLSMIDPGPGIAQSSQVPGDKEQTDLPAGFTPVGSPSNTPDSVTARPTAAGSPAPICGAHMPIADAYCVLPTGHGGHHRSLV